MTAKPPRGHTAKRTNRSKFLPGRGGSNRTKVKREDEKFDISEGLGST